MRRLLAVAVVLGTLAAVWLALLGRGSDSSAAGNPVTGAPVEPGPDQEPAAAGGAPARSRPAPAPDAAVAPPAAEAAAAPAPMGSPACLVYGSARLESGETPQLGVALTPVTGAKRSVTARNGAFVLPGVPKGACTITCSYFGFHEETRQLDLVADEMRIDFVLRRKARIAVHARTPAGKPLLAALAASGHYLLDQALGAVATTAALSGELLPGGDGPPRIGLGQWSTTHGEGRVRGEIGEILLEDDPPGAFFVSLVLRSVVLASRRVEGLPAEVDFAIEPDAVIRCFASAHVVVVDESDRPLAGARASVGHSTDHQSTTDAGGRATYSSLVPGHQHLTVSSPGREAHVSLHRVRAGRDHDLGVVRLGPALNPTGVLVDASGAPLAGVRVSMRSLASAVMQPRAAETDAAGEFVLHSVGRGTWWLHASTEDKRLVAAARIELSGDPEQRVRLVARPGHAVTLRLACSPDTIHALRITDAEGLPWWSTAAATSRWSPRVRLPDGPYYLAIGDGTTWRPSIPLRVAGRDQEIEVRP